MWSCYYTPINFSTQGKTPENAQCIDKFWHDIIINFSFQQIKNWKKKQAWKVFLWYGISERIKLHQNSKNFVKWPHYCLPLKSHPNERTFSSHSIKLDTDFFSYCLIFVGSSPTWGDIFFLKSYTKWSFFIHSNVLESLVINFRGHITSKLKFIQEVSKMVIAIYLCGIYLL